MNMQKSYSTHKLSTSRGPKDLRMQKSLWAAAEIENQ